MPHVSFSTIITSEVVTTNSLVDFNETLGASGQERRDAVKSAL
jgi:hypothetical protein